MATTQTSPAQGMSAADFAKFRPLNGFILVQREPPPDHIGLIALVPSGSDRQRKSVTTARVVRIGGLEYCRKSGRPIPLDIREGDRVLLDAYAGHDIELAETGERFVLVGEGEVFCVLGEEISVLAQRNPYRLT